jgi:hypothetical protein
MVKGSLHSPTVLPLRYTFDRMLDELYRKSRHSGEPTPPGIETRLQRPAHKLPQESSIKFQHSKQELQSI